VYLEVVQVGEGEKGLLHLGHFDQTHVHILVQELEDDLLNLPALRKDLLYVVIIVADVLHDVRQVKRYGRRIDRKPLVFLEPKVLKVS